ncbi:MAG: LytR/AlgR family response regulator transcription factor [Chitinophagales bacterium]
MKCLIVDDEAISRRTLVKMCSKIGFLDVIAECSDATQALIYLQNEDIDLIFLDIHMPNMTGIEFVRSMRQLPQVIFSTSDENFALEAFEYNVTDYIIKPVTYPRFLKAVQKAHAIYESESVSSPIQTPKIEQQTLFLKEDGRFTKLNISDILWIESVGDYANFITVKDKHTVHATLKKIELRLPADKFHKIHRKYIINLSKIIDIEDNSVLIKDKILPISRRNKDSLMKKLNLI